VSRYFIWQGADSKFYYRTSVDGKGPAGVGQIAPTETTSAGFNTYALLQTDLQAKVFAECNWFEVVL
jgi:hypothetical protein